MASCLPAAGGGCLIAGLQLLIETELLGSFWEDGKSPHPADKLCVTRTTPQPGQAPSPKAHQLPCPAP